MFCATGANRHDSVLFEEWVKALPSVPGRVGKPRIRFERRIHTHLALHVQFDALHRYAQPR